MCVDFFVETAEARRLMRDAQKDQQLQRERNEELSGANGEMRLQVQRLEAELLHANKEVGS